MGISKQQLLSVISPKLFKLIRRELPDLRKVILGGEKVSEIDPGDRSVIVSYAQTEAMDILRYRVDAVDCIHDELGSNEEALKIVRDFAVSVLDAEKAERFLKQR